MDYNILTNQILTLIQTIRVTREFIAGSMFDYWFRIRTDSTQDINVRIQRSYLRLTSTHFDTLTRTHMPPLNAQETTTLMGRDIRDVQTLIEDAFVGNQRDDDCTLHQSQLSDTLGEFDISDEEWNRLRDAERFRDPETDWRTVPAAALEERDVALSHATPY